MAEIVTSITSMTADPGRRQADRSANRPAVLRVSGDGCGSG